MAVRNFKPLSCDLDENGSESIHRAVALAHLYSTHHGQGDTQSARLAILVEEIVTNLYDHAAPAAGFSGRLMLANDTDGVRISLWDSGPPFDPRDATALDQPNPERGGGVGLAMTMAWAKVVDYRRERDFNRLDLRLRT